MKYTVYSKVYPVWLLQTVRQVGSIPAGSFVTNVNAHKRSDPIFADWFANNGMKRRDFRFVKGFITGIPLNAEVYRH